VGYLDKMFFTNIFFCFKGAKSFPKEIQHRLTKTKMVI